MNDQLCGDDYDQKKSLYVIVCQQSPMMEEKIRRICASFPGQTFNVNINTLREDIKKANDERLASRDVISKTKMMFRDLLINENDKYKADVSVFKVFEIFVRRQKYIFIHMNML